MPHVVTQSCCSDASCVYACPVNCIHPTPDEPGFATAEMLYVDPATCVDCGACITACPVGAIVPHARLRPDQQNYLELNADFYASGAGPGPSERPLLAPMITSTAAVRPDLGPLRVAVVGSGPAGMYAADEVLRQTGAQVDVFDRLPMPYGLVRSGVAPDHPQTKQVTDLFELIAREPGFEFFLNVEVGRDLDHAELLPHYHAVVYAVGAAADRRLDVPGADLPGVGSATEFVGWYNGHPDHQHHRFDLSGNRAVIVGNGNVALDVARILLADRDRLAGTDITRAALAALRAGTIGEVVLLGRRGPADSAFTVPELAGLIACPDFDVVVDRSGGPAPDPAAPELSFAARHKLALLAGLPDLADAVPDRKRVVLRYGRTTRAIHGPGYVDEIETEPTPGTDGRVEKIATRLLLTSIGYHGRPVPGLPFDPARGIVPNRAGRVEGTAGAYVTGWIKRGPSGFVGTNKSCAHETLQTLVADFNAGRLARPAQSAAQLSRLVAARRPDRLDSAGWARLDAAERQRGRELGCIRDKITEVDQAVQIAAAQSRKGLLGFVR
ncbi:FAD-dependent oxidoreductase [Skermania piniformis]|uniref:ferredoxin--NADP(+) reductase n=1 Tax=Skermania pinensis TaxID=39122 RepID=A0ABX8SEV7_9ACTN|nr:FAD-dependent oxidoreductase [Skermania piniformis]